MRWYLVRHASAGDRWAWEGDDRDRPLTKKGWRQAEALATRLSTEASGVLVASPYVRCRQTLEPLAASLDRVLLTDATLAEGGDPYLVLDRLEGWGDGAVLCSHGDVIPDLVNVWLRRGAEVEGDVGCSKASIWVATGPSADEVTHLRYEPPPGV